MLADLPHDCERSDTPHNHLVQAVCPALQLLLCSSAGGLQYSMLPPLAVQST